MLKNTLYSVVPSRTSLATDTKATDVERYVIIDDDEIVGADFIEIENCPHALAREVHKGLRFDKQNAFARDSYLTHKSFVGTLVYTGIILIANIVYCKKARIMSCMKILATGITKSHNDVGDWLTR